MRFTILFDTVLLFLYITGLSLEAKSKHLGTSRHVWLCLALFCTLQLQVSTSVRTTIVYVFQSTNTIKGCTISFHLQLLCLADMDFLWNLGTCHSSRSDHISIQVYGSNRYIHWTRLTSHSRNSEKYMYGFVYPALAFELFLCVDKISKQLQKHTAILQHRVPGVEGAELKPLLNLFRCIYMLPACCAVIASVILIALLSLELEDLETHLCQIFILVSDSSSYLERTLTYSLPGICLY
jgi:hypothetical protein